MSHSYQLTKYPVGSKREFLVLSWPLMVGLISTSLMIFVDRIFLARFNPLTLNAAVSAGVAYYIFLVIPMGVALIAEVLVGRLHGEDKFEEIGSATWQMIWFGVLLTPFFLLAAWLMPPILFGGTDYEIFETQYFEILIVFAPIHCVIVALSGFFIGIGNVKVVTLCAIIGTIANTILDYILIFGTETIPALGIRGAAIGTVISEVIQMLFLFWIFFSYKNKIFQTLKWKINKFLLLEGIKIGMPSGIGHCIEVVAHFLFFRCVMSVGPEQMTIVAMVQSLYILSSFILEAQSKAASAIVANLLGAGHKKPIKKVLKSSFILQTLYFIGFAGSLCLFPEFFFNLFSSSIHKDLLANPSLANTFLIALAFMSLFFLLDGFCWILIGFLTAAGDTRFILVITIIVYWIAYAFPTLLLVGWQQGGADIAWGIVAAMSLLNFVMYLWRYKTGAWLKYYHPL
ncbi:MAG: MATE family efflux transporter [Chlamydiales bacterium]|nr:MATE family efflux transporter [Chlamydiales bacterium]